MKNDIYIYNSLYSDDILFTCITIQHAMFEGLCILHFRCCFGLQKYPNSCSIGDAVQSTLGPEEVKFSQKTFLAARGEGAFSKFTPMGKPMGLHPTKMSWLAEKPLTSGRGDVKGGVGWFAIKLSMNCKVWFLNVHMFWSDFDSFAAGFNID